MKRAILILWVALVSVSAPLNAQIADTATVPPDIPFFAPRDAAVAGGFLLGTVVLAPIDRAIARRLQDSTTQGNRLLQTGAGTFNTVAIPGAAIIGTTLYVVGRVGGYRRVADLGLHGTEAVVIASGVNNLLKGVFGRGRPYLDPEKPYNFELGRGFANEEFRSFPSGHTVAAFAAAAAVTSEAARVWPERRWWIATLLYGGAGMVGMSRMYDNKHWASDVAVGAAIGTFTGAKVVRYNHSNPNNRVNRLLLPVSVVPDGSGGVLLAVSVAVR